MNITQKILQIWMMPALAFLNLRWAPAAVETSAPEQVVFYVRSGSSGNCRSWLRACSLQTALDRTHSGYEIWVAAGEYKPGTSSAARTATFQLKGGVALYGGFNGTESEKNQRNWTANPAILNGDIDNDGELSGNVYHVVSARGLTEPALLDGFTVMGGNADNDPIGEIWGGGMYAENSKLTLRNIIFTDNFARLGGGLFIHSGDQTVLLEDTLFNSNEALHSGGGLYAENGSNLTLTDVVFSANQAGLSGGGMASFDSDPSLINVSFLRNSAGSCGGMSNGDRSSPTLTNVVFDGNLAKDNGGAMCNSTYTSPVLNQVTFLDNHAGYGGAMSNFRSSLTLTNVKFLGNSAEISGGAILNILASSWLINSSFWGNSAGEGGAIYNNSSIVTLTNVTLYGNSAVENGGAVSNHVYSAFNLINVILWGNTPEQIFNDPAQPSTIVINYSDIEGGFAGDHNIDADPLFVDAATGDLHLMRQSPAVDEGDNRAVPLEVVTDLDGDPRFVDIPEQPDSGFGSPAVDMGAYEVQLPRLYFPQVLK